MLLVMFYLLTLYYGSFVCIKCYKVNTVLCFFCPSAPSTELAQHATAAQEIRRYEKWSSRKNLFHITFSVTRRLESMVQLSEENALSLCICTRTVIFRGTT